MANMAEYNFVVRGKIFIQKVVSSWSTLQGMAEEADTLGTSRIFLDRHIDERKMEDCVGTSVLHCTVPCSTFYSILIETRGHKSKRVEWCCSKNLALNVSKMKEMIVEFRKGKTKEHIPILIEGSEVERVSSFKFPCVKISEDLVSSQVKSLLLSFQP